MKREPSTAAKRARRAAGASAPSSSGRSWEDAVAWRLRSRPLRSSIDLNTNLLFKWRRDHMRRLAHDAAASKMLPVVVDQPVIASTTQRITPSVIEVELPAGRIRLKGAVDVESLRVVIELLSRR